MQYLNTLEKTPVTLPVISVKVILSTIQRWRERAITRHKLALLPEYRLEDMGINSQQALEESQKPFWKE